MADELPPEAQISQPRLPPKGPSGDDRAARLAQALRANLRRRKDQERERGAHDPAAAAETAAGEPDGPSD